MKILILNGNPDPENSIFEEALNKFHLKADSSSTGIEEIILRDKNIIHCTGCWNCWVKNPGECSFEDDTKEIRAKIIHSDMVIFASPLILGFISALMKKTMDKLIPLLHPYIEIVQKETHHTGRYDHYPGIGLMYQDPENDPEDVEITQNIFKRFALNFRSKLFFCRSINEEIPEFNYEISHH